MRFAAVICAMPAVLLTSGLSEAMAQDKRRVELKRTSRSVIVVKDVTPKRAPVQVKGVVAAKPASTPVMRPTILNSKAAAKKRLPKKIARQKLAPKPAVKLLKTPGPAPAALAAPLAAKAPAAMKAPAAAPVAMKAPVALKAPAQMVPASAPAPVKPIATPAYSAPAKIEEPVIAKPAPRRPQLRASVNLSSQRMTVTVDGEVRHVWPISSGRAGYSTPTGTYKPYRMHTMWRSRKYNNAKMPHSVFYSGGYAVHATYATGRLGRPASHGCVRLSPSSARKFFNLVKRHGRANTTIAISGRAPASRSYARKRTRSRRRVRRAQNRRYTARKYRRRQYAQRRYVAAKKPKSLLQALFD